MRFLLPLMVLLTGCVVGGEPLDAEPVLPDLPLRVWLSAELSADHRAGAEAALDRWEGLVPGLVASVAVGERQGCGVVVRYADVDGADGQARYLGGCFTEVVIERDTGSAERVEWLMLHEVGHMLLGPDHHADPANLMAEPMGSHLTDEQIAAARARVAE
jgi:hypothetical protein